jgi:hypothetical protein
MGNTVIAPTFLITVLGGDKAALPYGWTPRASLYPTESESLWFLPGIKR